jgi:hypothetical protein
VPEAGTYSGGCHCGRVGYEVATDLGQVVACNCSICTKRGFLWTFVPPAQFDLRSGEDALAEYQFGRKAIRHLFCTSCGVESFARGRKSDGTEAVAINVRCLDGVDPNAINTVPFNGRDL